METEKAIVEILKINGENHIDIDDMIRILDTYDKSEILCSISELINKNQLKIMKWGKYKILILLNHNTVK